MSQRPRQLLAGFAAVLLGLAGLLASGADDAQQRSVAASWQRSGQETQLKVALAGQLSKKQLDLINSGFATYAEVQIRRFDESGKLEQTPVYRGACSVRYDLWEERYEIVRLSDIPLIKQGASLELFNEQCLSVRLYEARALGILAPKGGTLVASIVLEQLSAQREREIKDWLIKQQSGVMQGLFAHMLGNLKLVERRDVVVRAPPRPKKLEDVGEAANDG